jgi:hypothetical protein
VSSIRNGVRLFINLVIISASYPVPAVPVVGFVGFARIV